MVVSDFQFWKPCGGVPTATVNVVEVVETGSVGTSADSDRTMVMIFVPGVVNEVLANCPVWGVPPSMVQTVLLLSASGSTS